MYSINIILFICVSLNFLHCLCVDPTDDELQLISQLFNQCEKDSREDGLVDVDDLKKILDEIADQSKTSETVPTLETLQAKLNGRWFTLGEVKSIGKQFLASQDPTKQAKK